MTSRAQRAYAKRSKAHNKRFTNKVLDIPIDKSRAVTVREQHTSTHYLVEDYGVTKHAAERFFERIMEITIKPSKKDLCKAAVMLRKNLPELESHSCGKYNFMDEWQVVVRNGIVVTVLKKVKYE